MREIEFRAKDQYGNWIYGLLTGNQYNLNEYAIFTQPYHGIYPIEKETIGQYTGLRDKNGVKIFEGDIVKYEQKEYSFSLKIGIAEFNDSDLGSCGCCFDEHYSTGFVIKTVKPKNNSSKFFSQYGLEKCEVIGNIYDNQELLEKEK